MENTKQFTTSIIIELILICIGLIGYKLMPIYLNISKDISFSISIFAILLSVAVISIKFFIYKSLSKQIKDFSTSIALANTLTQKIACMKSPNLNYAKQILVNTHNQIDKIENGIIHLSEDDYYHLIINESKELKQNDTVFAVNTFEELRFEEDPRQIKYFDSNIKAINTNSINFKRIFVIDVDSINTSDGKKKIQIIKKNIEKGINVKIVDKKHLKGKNKLLTDWVLFKNSKKQKLYIDYQDKVDKTRVSYGELIINQTIINEFIEKFIVLEEYAFDKDKMKTLFNMELIWK